MHKAKSPDSVSSKHVTLADAYAAFITSRQAQNVTEGTLGYYDDKLLPFVEWCGGRNVTAVDAVTADHVRAHLVHLQGRDLAPWTIHGAARAVRAFLHFCEEDGLIVKAPTFKMPKVPKRTLPAFEPGDVERLLDGCLQFRDRVIILFLLDTGLRAAELIALNGGDIDERTGAVWVRQGKGQKDRTVYLGAKTRRELGRYWREQWRPSEAAPAWTCTPWRR